MFEWSERLNFSIQLVLNIPSQSPARLDYGSWTESKIKGDESTKMINETEQSGSEFDVFLSLIFLSSVPPIFRRTPSNISVEETESALLSCTASSEDSTITWLKDGKVIAGDHFIFLKRGLLILRAYPEDKGWYVCNATNRAGSKVARAYLHVWPSTSNNG